MPTLGAAHAALAVRAPILPDHWAGCLVGQAVGDALGFVVEGSPPGLTSEYVDRCVRTGRTELCCRPPFEPLQYSDDTQLARELMLAFCEARGFDPAVFAARVAALFSDGRDVGAGPGTRGAAARLRAGIPWSNAGTPAPYAGNGSAMRTAPVGLWFAHEPDRLVAVAAEQSRITHADPRCAAGAIAIAGATALAARPGSIEPRSFLGELAEWVAVADADVAAALVGIADWPRDDPTAAAARLHAACLDPIAAGPWEGVSSFVVASTAWSLYAFLRSPDDYLETVGTAIAVGGDTDTLAAMAGALAGARVGLDGVPAALALAVHDRGAWRGGELENLARECAAIAGA